MVIGAPDFGPLISTLKFGIHCNQWNMLKKPRCSTLPASEALRSQRPDGKRRKDPMPCHGEFQP
jgi:hypothetical protein